MRRARALTAIVVVLLALGALPAAAGPPRQDGAVLVAPTSSAPAVVSPGADVAAAFVSDLGGTYVVSYHPSGGGEWADFPGATGAATGGSTTKAPLTAPAAPGAYDLRVTVSVQGVVSEWVTEPRALIVTAVGVTEGQRCDPIDPAACLLPFPNDHFTAADPGTDTGRVVNLDLSSMPRNVAGKPIDPTEWNRNDGFSPGSMLLAQVPGLDLHQTWRTTGLPPRERDNIADISRSLAPDAPIVLLNTRTGERHPFWSELDTRPGVSGDKQALIIRPARNLEEGTRYVVALRRMKDANGARIPAGPAFVAFRDRLPSALPDRDVAARRPAMERIFADLRAAGVGRSDLYLAWDFTVASERNLSERALSIRDDAFAQLGDTNLANSVIEGDAPAFTVTKVTEFTPEQNRGTARRVEGTIRVPNYLTPQVRSETASPPAPLDDFPVAAPGSRFNYAGSTDGLPRQNPVQPTLDIAYTCNIPHTAATTPAHPVLYGHGLLGGKSEANGGSAEDLRLRGFATCAVDWMGMAFEDASNIGAILADASNFPSLADRAQQGFLNFLYLGRALAHPDGLGADPAFRAADGTRLLTEGELYYEGNSQGGIMGGALTALAPDFTTAALGVPGMNYSTLLNRSADFEGPLVPDEPPPDGLPSYASIMYTSYPDKLDEQLVFALLQMLWDRAEADGYALHMTDDPLPNTPAHNVMLQVAFADHQVANITAEVEGRTIGAQMRWPALADGLHWSVDPLFGFQQATYGTPGSFLVYWYGEGNGNTTPPNGNIPSRSGTDPHGQPRGDNRGSDQKATFLLTGTLIDVCSGPCVTSEASRSNG
jgi:hypothetical protein